MNTDTLPDHLTVLAQSIESITPAGIPPAFVEIVGGLDPPDSVRWHADVAELLGFVAPPDCQAVVFVGEGTARPLAGGPPDVVGLLKPGEQRRCKTVFLLTRDGDAAGYCREGATILIDEPPTIGRIPDSIRRSLGLPTPPPDQPTDGLLARLWLNEVISVAERASAPLGWPEVAQLHPVMKVCAEGGLTIPLTDLVHYLHIASSEWTWSFLVAQSIGPGWMADFLPPGAAGWMDEGMLSRWLLGSFPPVADLLERARPLISPAAARKLRVILRKLNVVGSHHPDSRNVPNT